MGKYTSSTALPVFFYYYVTTYYVSSTNNNNSRWKSSATTLAEAISTEYKPTQHICIVGNTKSATTAIDYFKENYDLDLEIDKLNRTEQSENSSLSILNRRTVCIINRWFEEDFDNYGYYKINPETVNETVNETTIGLADVSACVG